MEQTNPTKNTACKGIETAPKKDKRATRVSLESIIAAALPGADIKQKDGVLHVHLERGGA